MAAASDHVREIELELCAHELHGVEQARAWARYVVRHSPDDVQVRIAMATAIRERFDATDALTVRVDAIGRGQFVFDRDGPARAEVHVFGLAPAECACDCADFLRNALGVCAHAVVAGRLARGQFASTPLLQWAPVRPWHDDDAPWSRLLVRASHAPRASGSITGFSDEDWNVGSDGTWCLDANRTDDELTAASDRLLAMIDGESASPAARAVVMALGDHTALLRQLQEVTRSTWRPDLLRKLFPYQEEGVRLLVGRGRLLLGDEMGLGKTTQSIAAATALVSCGAVTRGLFVVPASLKSQWQREWRDVSRVRLTVVEGTGEQRRAALGAMTKGIALMNYEQVVREIDALREWAPELVVLDEAQRIKNAATKTAITLKSLRPRYRWLLTGTPFANRLSELASLVEWIDDFALEPKWRLEPFHSYRGCDELPGGASNLRTLRARIGSRVVRRTRAQVMEQLPPRIDTHVVVPMSCMQTVMHDELAPSIAVLAAILQRRALLPREFLRLMKLLNRQRLISNAAVLAFDPACSADLVLDAPARAIEQLGSPKLLEFRELVRTQVIGGGQKLVVFSEWRRMLDWAAWSVRDLLVDGGFEAAFFTGSESLEKRRENVIRFHDHDALRILFLTDAGGVGLNLQRAAASLVNLELPWNPAVLEQRIGRIHRFGQAKPVQVFLVRSSDGIEARIAKLVGDKRALFRTLFDTDLDEFVYSAGDSRRSMGSIA